jgi:hypothetical protein
MLGQANLALCFRIPSQANLHGILKSIAHYATQMALRFRLAQRFLGENAGLRLASKRGCFVKNIGKPACECLFHNKSSIRTANQPEPRLFTSHFSPVTFFSVI